MVQKAEIYMDEYEKIWISRNGWGWIHVLFHTQYDPATFQKEVTHSDPNELGFWWVSDFGKYHLENFPQPFLLQKDTLYIGTPAEFSSNTIPLNRVVHNNQDVYWFVR